MEITYLELKALLEGFSYFFGGIVFAWAVVVGMTHI